MLEKRPKIKITNTPLDLLLECSGCFTLCLLGTLVVYCYPMWPATIPVHFNAAGAPDRVAGKNQLFALPCVAAIVFIGLTALNGFPHIFNYPVTITEYNAQKQYQLTKRLLRYLKLVIPLIFLTIVYQTDQLVHGERASLSVWFLPAALILLLVPMLIYFRQALKHK